jgi:kynurenine formamidase
MPTITYSRVVDLSHPLQPDMPNWPGDPPTRFNVLARIPQDGYFLRGLRLGEHSGTHLNAPAHFIAGGLSVDAIPAQHLVLPAALIDARAQCARDPDYSLSPPDLLAWEERHGPFPPACLVVLFTGWQERWSIPRHFLNLDPSGQPHFPGFSLDAARLLLEERGAAGLGSDAHGIEPGLDTAFSVNQFALARSALVLENLTNLDQLPPLGATLIIGRLALTGGSGSPAAVLALLP